MVAIVNDFAAIKKAMGKLGTRNEAEVQGELFKEQTLKKTAALISEQKKLDMKFWQIAQDEQVKKNIEKYVVHGKQMPVVTKSFEDIFAEEPERVAKPPGKLHPVPMHFPRLADSTRCAGILRELQSLLSDQGKTAQLSYDDQEMKHKISTESATLAYAVNKLLKLLSNG